MNRWKFDSNINFLHIEKFKQKNHIMKKGKKNQFTIYRERIALCMYFIDEQNVYSSILWNRCDINILNIVTSSIIINKIPIILLNGTIAEATAVKEKKKRTNHQDTSPRNIKNENLKMQLNGFENSYYEWPI